MNITLMEPELLNSISVTLLIAASLTLLGPVFYWLLTAGRGFNTRHG